MAASKTKKSYGGKGLQWYSSSNIKKGTEMIAGHIGRIKDNLRYWTSEEGGFLFNRAAANNLANFMRKSIEDQEGFGHLPALSPYYKGIKATMGLDPRIGIATGSYKNAIKSMTESGSEFKVGVPPGIRQRPSKKKVKTKSGKIKYRKIGNYIEIAKYAKVLEFGRPATGWGGEQLPRPIFGILFSRWYRQNIPDLIHSTFGQEFEQELRALGALASAQGSIDAAEAAEMVSDIGPGKIEDEEAHLPGGKAIGIEEVSPEERKGSSLRIGTVGESPRAPAGQELGKTIGQAFYGTRKVWIANLKGTYQVIFDDTKEMVQDTDALELMHQLAELNIWSTDY